MRQRTVGCFSVIFLMGDLQIAEGANGVAGGIVTV